MGESGRGRTACLGLLPPLPVLSWAHVGPEAGMQSGKGEYTHLGPPGTVLATGRDRREERGEIETERFVPHSQHPVQAGSPELGRPAAWGPAVQPHGGLQGLCL